MRKQVKHNNHNRGFSLVELIIVVAIMAILAGAIAPALIKYISKTRKSTDISNAEEIAKAFTRLATENEDIYDYLLWSAGEFRGKRTSSQYYRVLTFCNSPRGNRNFRQSPFVCMSGAPNQSTLAQLIPQEMAKYIGSDTPRMSFQKANGLDEWIICTDPYCNIYVFAGVGMNNARWFLTDESKTPNGRQCYMLYPEVDPAYEELSKPPDTQ